MKGRPKISFLVPCYNYGKYLGDCLKSIFNQEKYEDFEVVVVNDASTDNTADVISEYKDSRLVVINHPQNKGLIDTINEGLMKTQGEYIARIDADDRYCEWFLKETVPFLDRDKNIGAVYGSVNLINEKGEVTHPHSRPNGHMGDKAENVYLQLLEENFLCAPTLIARSELWKRSVPVPRDFTHSDWYFNLMMARMAPMQYRDRVIAEYRVHPTNHHTKITANRSEEPTTFKILDMMFNEVEIDERLEWRKQKAKRKIYGAHYALLARKYFGKKLFADSRRCFLEALRWNPRIALDSVQVRLQVAAFIGDKNYEQIKRIAKKLGR